MSTDYYLGCEKCKEAYHIGQDGWKFFTFYSGEPRCMDGIGKFMERHINGDGCKLIVISEYQIDDNEWTYIKWPNAQNSTEHSTEQNKNKSRS